MSLLYGRFGSDDAHFPLCVKNIVGPSGDDRIQINVHEIPPETVEVHWQTLAADWTPHYYDLKVIDQTSSEVTFYQKVKGKAITFFCLF